MISVRVPASSANIGPGFDSVGIALNMVANFTFEKHEGLFITGCPQEYCNENNLVYTSMLKVFEKAGREIFGVHIHMDTPIPLSRGLGSSSTCIVGGLLGANALLGNKFSKEEIFQMATEIEGHPDNVAPAIFGGCTSSFMSDQAYSTKFEIHDKFQFCALIPDFELSTEKARKALPEKIPFADAVFNLSRIPSLLKALESGNEVLLEKALDDKLHQPYRKSLIPEYDKVEEICKRSGSHAVFLSGAGPTMMNIVSDLTFVDKIKEEISKLDHNWKIVLLQADNEGSMVKVYD